MKGTTMKTDINIREGLGWLVTEAKTLLKNLKTDQEEQKVFLGLQRLKNLFGTIEEDFPTQSELGEDLTHCINMVDQHFRRGDSEVLNKVEEQVKKMRRIFRKTGLIDPAKFECVVCKREVDSTKMITVQKGIHIVDMCIHHPGAYPAHLVMNKLNATMLTEKIRVMEYMYRMPAQVLACTTDELECRSQHYG